MHKPGGPNRNSGPTESCARNSRGCSCKMNIATRCRRALHHALAAYSPTASFDSRGYVLDLRDNLLPGIDLDAIRPDFEAGAGHELEGKMRAPHSSSALAVNMFGRWRRDPISLRLQGETGFESLRCEAQCSTGLGGTAPHLDVLAVSRDAVVAVESKCLEYLQVKPAFFSPSYDTIADERAGSTFFKLIPRLRTNAGEFRSLDAAQLVKHYLGLSKSWPGKRLTLLYAYWEPKNANGFIEFVEHRKEIDRFCELVRAEPNFTFRAACHRELWTEWESADIPGWLGDQVLALRQRYDVLI